MQPRGLEAVVADVAERAARREPACGATRVVAVDGRSGSGKTSFAAALAAHLRAPVLHLEDLYPGWHGLAATPPIAKQVLDAIAIGNHGHARRWDWAADRPGEVLTVPAVPTLVIEGVGAGAELLRPHVSLLVWLEAPAQVRKDRALARDGETFAPWWDVWAEQEDDYLRRDRPDRRADVIIDDGMAS